MEYKPQQSPGFRVQPRLIIHGGAGNITPASLGPELYAAYRSSLLTIVSKTHTYLTTPQSEALSDSVASKKLPSSLEAATYAVTLLEDNPLFNSGHGAVFTRDGINELEASVMVSRGQAKRGVGVTGLRHVRNPILLAKKVLEHGEDDLLGRGKKLDNGGTPPDVPSAQGHTLIHGPTAEKLARQYELEMVDPGYFFTQKRWDEHVRALEREKREQQQDGMLGASGVSSSASATWSKDEYLPQGTVGAVALDEEGVICVATSTGGMTNKLTGRIGDTPVVGAGFWAEEWTEEGDPASHKSGLRNPLYSAGPAVILSDALKGLIADCLPSPFLYTLALQGSSGELTTTRSIGVSGTGNGDSYLRIAAARTVGAIARYSPLPSAVALTKVAGPSGELQKSAEDRWGQTGEGEGGIIGLESVVVRDVNGNVVETRSAILQDYNCGGMFRAWIDGEGVAYARIFRKDQDIPSSYIGEGKPEDPRVWNGEKI